MMPGTRPPFQGDSLGDVFPRAEAHGLFCFRPLGDGKMSKLKGWAVPARQTGTADLNGEGEEAHPHCGRPLPDGDIPQWGRTI